MLLALCLVLALAACGQPEATENQSRQPDSSQTPTTQPEDVGTKTVYVLVTKTTTNYVDGEIEYSTGIQNYYDANGWMTKQERTGKDGNTDTYTAELDQYGRVVSLTYAGEGTPKSYTYEYDRWGNVVCELFQRDVDYVSKSWTYDADGSLLSYEEKELFSTVSEQYIYEAGRLSTIVKYRGENQTGSYCYDYDEQGRIANIFYYDVGEDTPFCTYIYSYSDDGLTTYVDHDYNYPALEQQDVMVVDAYGNIVRQETKEGGRTTVVEYTYQAIEIPANYPRKN